jgi:hypothetical protein
MTEYNQRAEITARNSINKKKFLETSLKLVKQYSKDPLLGAM